MLIDKLLEPKLLSMEFIFIIIIVILVTEFIISLIHSIMARKIVFCSVPSIGHWG